MPDPPEPNRLMRPLRWLGKPLGCALLGVAVLLLGTLFHEGGHIVVAWWFGAELRHVAVMPGLQLFPELASVPWDGWVARVSSRGGDASAATRGWVALMGSGTNALVALGLVVGLWVWLQGVERRAWAAPAGWVVVGWCMAVGVWAWDGVGYTFAPLLGLKHWVFVGGRASETLKAAELLGWDASWFGVGVVAYAVVVYGVAGALLMRWLRLERWRPDTDPPHFSD